MADKLIDLLEHSERAAGREKVAARYTWERLAALTEAVYEHVLVGKRA